MNCENLSVRDADYLIALFKCGGEARLSEVCRELKVAKPTASLMMKKLSTAGLVRKVSNKYALTVLGRKTAKEIIWRHTVTEWMLVKSGLNIREACRVARIIELYIPLNSLKKIWSMLGKPVKCPCGYESTGNNGTCRPVHN